MTHHLSKSILRCLFGLSISLISCLKAELPSFQETPWLGYFAYGKGDVMMIKISADGDISSHPLGKNKEQKPYLKIPFKISLRETLPNGRVRKLPFDPKSLQSDSKIIDDLQQVSITGEFGSGASFEVNIHFKRDILTLGGHITENGTHKNPLSFHLESRLNHFHGNLLKRLDGDQKKFDQIVGKDWFELHHTDKKKEKRQLTDLGEEGSNDDLNGPGSSKTEVQANIIDKKKRLLIFEAKGSSLLNLTKPKAGPFHQGYVIEWSPDQAKDPKNEARLVFEIDKI